MMERETGMDDWTNRQRTDRQTDRVREDQLEEEEEEF